MKKVIALLLAAVMVFALCACGSSSSAPAASTSTAPAATAEPAAPEAKPESTERTKLYFWFWGASTEYQEHMKKVLCDWYNESQDEYELVLEFRSSVDSDIPVALAAGQGPDIVYGSMPSAIATYAEEGLVLNMNDYAAQYGWADRVLDISYEACTVDGNLYCMPGGLLVGILFYNNKVFEENGWTAPTTVEELEATMEAAKAAGYYPLGAGAKGWKGCNDHFGSMTMSAFVEPSYIYNALTGEGSFTDPAIVESVAKSAEWYQKGYLAGDDYVNLDSSEVMQTITNKQSAMVAAPTLYFQWVNPDYADDISYVPMPNVYSGDQNVWMVSNTSFYGVNANSVAPDECAKIIDHMYSAEFVLQMNEAWPAYWNMPIKEISTLSDETLTGIAKTCFDAVQDSIADVDAGYFWFHPSTFLPAATLTAYEDIDVVWQGVMTPEQFCETVQAELTSDIANGLVCPLAKPAI